MYGVTLKDRIKREELRDKFRLEGIDKVAEVHRLKWFGHVLRRPIGTMARDVVELKGDKHPRGLPNLRWEEVVEKDMKKTGLVRYDAQDRNRWRRLINVLFDDMFIVL